MIRVRRPFLLAAPVPISKSWLNRALILKSLHPALRIVEWEPSELDGEDIAYLSKALDRFAAGETDFDVGESGTGLRFLVARLSVEVGTFRIRGSAKLMSRPHAELFRALKIVGTETAMTDATTLEVRANGWPDRDLEISIDASESSQFASALHLAASALPRAFELKLTGTAVSRGYLDMTIAMVAQVKSGRKVLVAETDSSSVATLACVAVAASDYNRRKAIARLESQTWSTHEDQLTKTLGGLKEKVERTMQPDRAVFDVIESLRSDEGLRPVAVDLADAPDLFPVLAAVAAFAKGESKFTGAPHLRLKESDRIASVARLFETVGITFSEHADGLTVRGVSTSQQAEFEKRTRQGLAYQFDPESDHRLAFAAAVLAAGGIPIEISNRGVVTKSLPLFWTMIEGDAPRVALLGQRGVGKTETARRWGHELGARATQIDLDREVERLAGRSVDDVFKNLGEVEFRWFERQAWREVDAETRNSFGAVVVATGAGFDPGAIDDSWTRVWLRRATDERGRIFNDRPRLDPELAPLAESLERTKARAPRFQQSADRTLIVGEGAGDPAERAWCDDVFNVEERNSISFLGGAITLLAHHNISASCERWRRWGVSRIEIRDDIWSPTNDAPAWDYFVDSTVENFLVSFRDVNETAHTLKRIAQWIEHPSTSGPLAVDWPLERGELPTELSSWVEKGHVELIGSIHGAARDFSTERLSQEERQLARYPRAVMKVALTIADFKGLLPLHAWAQEKPSSRVLLPMSEGSPRWAWYRAWQGSLTSMGLSFWREDDGSSFDQPTFSQWWRRRRFQTKDFAAVLGDPVEHSRTPLEHDEFFCDRKMPVFAIPIARDEMPAALDFLMSLGLKAAAVTAPLKETLVAGHAFNTLAISDREMKTENTDTHGFETLWNSTSSLRANLPGGADRSVVVWGGGGVLPSIAKAIPAAIFYSASTGQPRDTKRISKPAIVVWAAGDNRGAWPADWKPNLIVDLSYTENSMGRAVALEAGARYVSGLAMFEAQAQAQREFWTKEL